MAKCYMSFRCKIDWQRESQEWEQNYCPNKDRRRVVKEARRYGFLKSAIYRENMSILQQLAIY